MQPAVFYPRGTSSAMTNAERQRLFRKRHPDYYKRYRARMKAAIEARQAQQQPATPPGLPAPEPLLQIPLPPITIEIREPVPVAVSSTTERGAQTPRRELPFDEAPSAA